MGPSLKLYQGIAIPPTLGSPGSHPYHTYQLDGSIKARRTRQLLGPAC